MSVPRVSIAVLVASLAAVSGCGARGRPGPPPAGPAPSATAAAPAVSAASPPAATPAISPGENRDGDGRHTDAFMIRPHPVSRPVDRRTYCASGACVGLGEQLAAISRAAKGRVAPACGDVGASACGARCGSVTLGTWSGGKAITFREEGSGVQTTHCHDPGGVLVAAISDGPGGPQFGDTGACDQSTPTRALCRPGVLAASCTDGRCLAFATMVASVTESAARSPDHGCAGVVTPLCGGSSPACTSVKAVTCPDYQSVIVRHAGGVYRYLYSSVGALVGTDHVPPLDSYQAPLVTFGPQPGGPSCSSPARDLCGGP